MQNNSFLRYSRNLDECFCYVWPQMQIKFGSNPSDSLQVAMPEPTASLTTRGVSRPQQQQSHHDDVSRRRYVRFLGQRIVKKYKRFARELEFRRLQSAVPEVRGREAVSKESDLIAFVAVLVNV